MSDEKAENPHNWNGEMGFLGMSGVSRMELPDWAEVQALLRERGHATMLCIETEDGKIEFRTIVTMPPPKLQILGPRSMGFAGKDMAKVGAPIRSILELRCLYSSKHFSFGKEGPGDARISESVYVVLAISQQHTWRSRGFSPLAGRLVEMDAALDEK